MSQTATQWKGGLMKTLGCAAFLLLCYVFSADAQQVYEGCQTPPSTFRNMWYIDPVNGKTATAGGNGSKASPWSSLEAVFQTTTGYSYPLLTTAPYRNSAGFVPGPNAGPIAPGDEILLMSGNYGAVSVGQYKAPINNSSFVTIAAAPGQTPVFTSLTVSASSGFVFSEIKAQSLETAEHEAAIITVGDQGASYPTSNIVLTNMSVSAADPSVYSTWTQAQWAANTRTGINLVGSSNGVDTTCVSITNSHITANHFGVEMMANNSLLSGNEIDHFGDDAVDYAASNIAMTKNYVHDALNFNIGAHMDAFQGYAGKPVAPATYYQFNNVLIDSNTIIDQVDPNLPYPTWLDGIDDYSFGTVAYNNATITNNVIVSSSDDGIVFINLTNSIIANNTVVQDELAGENGVPFITIPPTTAGFTNANVRVFNNLGSGLNMQSQDPTITADHNVFMIGAGGAVIFWFADGVGTYIGKPGTYGNANIIDTSGAPGEFVDFSPSTLTYNLMLQSTAQAIGAATATGAPSLDMLGVARTSPYAAGAYGYPQ
jgi:hypothetical protein